MRAGKRRHVFNDAEDWHIHTAEHRQCLRHIGEGDVLRRGDEHCAGNRYRLRQRELCIRGSRRQVNDEIVEVAPLHVAQELLNRTTDKGAAPNDRLALGDEELNGDDLDAVALDRLDLAARARLRGAGRPHHLGNVRPGDVSVEKADTGAALGQGHGQVHRDGALADAALPGGDGHNVTNAGEEALLGRG